MIKKVKEKTLETKNLSRSYGNNKAVENINLDLYRGEVLGLLGPNGAGKTTTMQMITGNLAPTSGSIKICNIDLLENPIAAKEKVGYLPESPPLYFELRVDEFLKLACEIHKVPQKSTQSSIDDAKIKCGLKDMGKKLISSLSKGYRQRVGIAQAIMHNPEIIILDEPTVGLDPNQIIEIRDLIKNLGKKHSVILSTHILPEVEAICDTVQILNKGTIVFNDHIKELKNFKDAEVFSVAYKNPPTLKVLREKIKDTSIQKIDKNTFKMSSKDKTVTDKLISLSVKNKWGLYQLTPSKASLEDVFVKLTVTK